MVEQQGTFVCLIDKYAPIAHKKRSPRDFKGKR
jgi:hypothetical protein